MAFASSPTSASLPVSLAKSAMMIDAVTAMLTLDEDESSARREVTSVQMCSENDEEESVPGMLVSSALFTTISSGSP
jgi:hypothetical protein